MSSSSEALAFMRRVYAEPNGVGWAPFARQALREGADDLEALLERVTALERAGDVLSVALLERLERTRVRYRAFQQSERWQKDNRDLEEWVRVRRAALGEEGNDATRIP